MSAETRLLHGRGRSTGRRGGAVLTSEDFSFRGFFFSRTSEDVSRTSEDVSIFCREVNLSSSDFIFIQRFYLIS